MSRTAISRLVAAVLTVALTAAAAVTTAGPAAAVANGEVVPEGHYRFSVKLTMTGIPTADGGRRNSACSGALIAAQWIVTAGHCFRDVDGVRVDRPVADLTTATVGRADLTGDNGEVATVVTVHQSPTNDLALAKLDQPVVGIMPVRLSRRAPQIGDVLRITGYGADNSVDPTPSTVLRTGQVQVTEVADATVGVTGYQPRPDTSACPYDSGAPYFVEPPRHHGRHHGGPWLVAVESFGPGCPHTGVETTSRVDTIADWIDGVIRN
ncbi:S1 family peptidase [Solwaraspora sp. WMMB335]|uniref:S1 family peptidase n=1 Tax=Solwaraspora sp. WMMB335 TaxID=3404118 RepID=UPI003B9513BB